MAKATKSDLEKKLAELDKKLAQISSAIETQRAQTQASKQESSQQTQQTPPPKPSPPPQQTPPPPPQQTQQQAPPPNSSYATVEKSRQEKLQDYEAEYLARLEKERRENEELMRAAAELKAQRQGQSKPATQSRGTLPKGF